MLNKIRDYLTAEGLPPFRFKQITSALQKGVTRFDEISELSKDLRQKLIKQFGAELLPLKIVTAQSAEQVEKVLFETPSGAHIETVWSNYRAGWSSVCISTQSGCAQNCSFCATACMGLVKNLDEDEIFAQVVNAHWRSKPDSIALMGMGEPLANPHIFDALGALMQYGGFSPRRISVSTVGYAPNLERLIREYPQVNITLSVHSPFPEQRAEMIPLENRFPLRENLAILDKYTVEHRRKVYLAYLLIQDYNDSPKHLQNLVKLIKGCKRPELFHVSVIRFNSAAGIQAKYQAPPVAQVADFVAKLRAQNIHATRRQQFGTSIDAACGQLHTKVSN